MTFVILALSGCAEEDRPNLAFPDPATEEAPRILLLWQGSWLAAIITGGVVWALIFWACVFHRKKGDEIPIQTRYNVPIEALYTIIPFIMVVVPATRTLGPGSTGMGVAMALTARELVIVLVFLALLGKSALDRRNVLATVKSIAVCAAVIAAHRVMSGLGPVRLALDALLYAVLAVAVGILRPRDVLAVLKMIRDRKKAQTEA